MPEMKGFGSGKDNIKAGIANPGFFCTDEKMDDTYANLWSANNDMSAPVEASVVKTIYDPCPVGYKMPPSDAFTGFSTTGDDTKHFDELNIKGGFDNGWNFYCGKKSGDTIFFPASGCRDSSTAELKTIGEIGYYWTSFGSKFAYNGNYLYFKSDDVDPLSNTYRGSGFSVRAIRE